jgi:hypothetical protein
MNVLLCVNIGKCVTMGNTGSWRSLPLSGCPQAPSSWDCVWQGLSGLSQVSGCGVRESMRIRLLSERGREEAKVEVEVGSGAGREGEGEGVGV